MNVKVITETLFDSVAAQASTSVRGRMNYNFHSGPEDNPHRFLNVLLRGTYIRPHRHQDPPKSEMFVALEGEADIILFDDHGSIADRYRLGVQSSDGKLWGVDLPPGVWHMIVARTARVVCLEIKPGPWEAATDKQFAEWAPAESDSSAAQEYLRAIVDYG